MKGKVRVESGERTIPHEDNSQLIQFPYLDLEALIAGGKGKA